MLFKAEIFGELDKPKRTVKPTRTKAERLFYINRLPKAKNIRGWPRFKAMNSVCRSSRET